MNLTRGTFVVVRVSGDGDRLGRVERAGAAVLQVRLFQHWINEWPESPTSVRPDAVLRLATEEDFRDFGATPAGPDRVVEVQGDRP